MDSSVAATVARHCGIRKFTAFVIGRLRFPRII
jgi:hypothetical protein